MPIKRALISVSNKKGIDKLAKTLQKAGVEILSTGGTARFLEDAGVSITKVSDVTGFPEIMDGRVKTLHPKIHGGILADRSKDTHIKAMEEHGIPPIDMVVVNLYPFEATIAKKDVTLPEGVEQIDIGGPAMLRAAAKNFAHVLIVVDPDDYSWIIPKVEKGEDFSLEERKALAAKAFAHTARYDGIISSYLSREDGFPVYLSLPLRRELELRYGENPHQKGAFYAISGHPVGMANLKQLQGKQLSFNNIYDLNAATLLAMEFTNECATVIVKHNTPCGVGKGEKLIEAYTKAWDCDPVSAYGGIIVCTAPVDREVAERIVSVFVEVLAAPAYTEEALKILSAKENLRVILLDPWPRIEDEEFEYKGVMGGLLVQERDAGLVEYDPPKVVTKREPTPDEWEAMLFGWKVVKHVRSNAILFSLKDRTLGIGSGQTSRVDSVKIAGMKARSSLQGAAMASDAFFPFPDGIEEAAKLGITAVIQPGGSIRDKEVIEAANAHNMAMVFTGMRHFRH